MVENHMSSRNIIGTNVAHGYYHVSIRGKDGRLIFQDDADYAFFHSLFEQYLAKKDAKEPNTTRYGELYDSVEVLAYCLMPTNFYLLICQISVHGLAELIKKITDDYSEYYRSKYHSDEPLFDDQLEATHVTSDDGLLQVTRHIHLTPDDWIDYPYSSLSAYLYGDTPSWLTRRHVTKLYGSAIRYLESLKKDIKVNHETLDT